MQNIRLKWLLLRRQLFTKWLEFRYRNQDGETCCCGSQIGKGGNICYHGGCRSMKDYTIEKEVERRFPNAQN